MLYRANKAELKAKIKKTALNTSASIDYLTVKDDCEAVAAEHNFKSPMHWSKDMTMNEWHAEHGNKTLEYKRDYRHYMTTDISVTKGVAKITTVGIPISKLADAMKCLMDIMNEN